jgi:ribonuclease I
LALDRNSTDHDFTIHGLWCQYDKEHYPEFCSKEKFNVTSIDPILNDMNKYWFSFYGNNEEFWGHEWSKHGTCSTLNQFNFFNETLDLYKTSSYKKFFNMCNNTELNCDIPYNKHFEPIPK